VSSSLAKPTGRQLALNRIRRYFPLIVWMVLISFASTDGFSAVNTSRIIGPILHWLFPNTSPETLAAIHYAVRKAAHFCEYAVLGLLSARAFRTSSQLILQRHWFLSALLLIAVFALADEYHQSFVSSRTGSVYDSLIDTSGGLVALILVSRRKARANRV
jgi:VanZ family protein